MMSKGSLTAARVVLAGAAAASLFFVRALQPGTIGATIFITVWLLLPYAVLSAVIERSARRPTAIADFVTMCLVAGGGLAFLTLVIFVNPDPQGGIAVLFTPVYQGIAMMILFPLLRSMLRKYRNRYRHLTGPHR
jgi:peptidoglycan/LPS O-acetylase OafA/YrhL